MPYDPDSFTGTSASGKRIPGDAKQFAEALIALLPDAFAEKKYIYGEIRYEDLPAADNSMQAAIAIAFPETDRELCLACDMKYKEFAAYSADPDTDPDATLAFMAGNVADIYNQEHMLDIKFAAAYERLTSNMKDKGYIMSHAYPVLVDASKSDYAVDATYGGWTVMPLPDDMNRTGNPNLSYAFEIHDPGLPISVRLRTPYSEDFTEEDMENLRKTALLNLENNILDRLAIDDSIEYDIKASFPVEIPEEMMRGIIAGIKQQSKLQAYTVSLGNTAMGVTSVLLSRMAMLKIAKRIGAKHMIQVIPQHMFGLLMLSYDDPAEAIPPDKAQEIAKRFEESNPDQTRTMLTQPLVYDVITGEISAI